MMGKIEVKFQHYMALLVAFSPPPSCMSHMRRQVVIPLDDLLSYGGNIPSHHRSLI